MNAVSPIVPIIEVSIAHRRVVIPYRADIESLVPGTKRLVWKEQDSLVIPHEGDAVRLARNFGISIPAPIELHYNWPHPPGQPPFVAQRTTAAMVSMFTRSYVLNGMGTGKTRALLWAYDFMRAEGMAKKMLVVAPLSTLERVWAREIFTVFPHLRYAVLHADTREKRLKRLDQDADIYIINHDGVNILFNELAARTDIDMLCLDELAVYRNPQSQRNKTMRKLAATKPRVVGLTGSPTPQAPTDAYGQVKIVTPSNISLPFRLFKDSVMSKVSEFRWVPKPTAQDVIHRVMQPAVRFTLDDVAELPDLVMREVKVKQGAKQTILYEHLRKHLHAMWEEHKIDIANAGVLMNKLLQVAMGWVYTNERGIVALDNDERLDALNDSIESSDRKVIVFVPYIHALDGVSEYLRKQGHSVEVVSGDTPMGQRNKIFGAFQTMSDPRVLVAHPQCMAHGLTLTAADTICWFGPFASLEIFDQANARIRRVGQKHKQQVLMFSGTPVETLLYRKLRERQAVQRTLLDMFEAQDSVV